MPGAFLYQDLSRCTISFTSEIYDVQDTESKIYWCVWRDKVSSKSESKQDTQYPPLPEGAKVVHIFTLAGKTKSVDIPIVEHPVLRERPTAGEDEIEHYRYALGWEKKLISGGFKKLIETTPYWGHANSFEDETYYYYDLRVIRRPGEELPKATINRAMKFYWEQGRKAYATVRKFAG